MKAVESTCWRSRSESSVSVSQAFSVRRSLLFGAFGVPGVLGVSLSLPSLACGSGTV